MDKNRKFTLYYWTWLSVMRTPLINVLHDSKRLVAVALTGPTMLTLNIGMLTKLTKTSINKKAA